MTLGGWVFLSVSVSAVTGMLVWCYRRLLSEDP